MATPKTLTLMAAAGLLAFTAPAYADWRSLEVRVADLDLSSSAGQEELENRIDRAVKNVCRSNASKALSERRDVARCESEARSVAMDKAEQKISAYRAKNPRMASSR